MATFFSPPTQIPAAAFLKHRCPLWKAIFQDPAEAEFPTAAQSQKNGQKKQRDNMCHPKAALMDSPSSHVDPTDLQHLL